MNSKETSSSQGYSSAASAGQSVRARAEQIFRDKVARSPVLLDDLSPEETQLMLHELRVLTGISFTRLHVVGGGAQNALLNQLTADACGIPVIAGPVEATALGNLLMQLVACGALGSVAEGRALVRASFPTEEYQPRRCA